MLLQRRFDQVLSVHHQVTSDWLISDICWLVWYLGHVMSVLVRFLLNQCFTTKDWTHVSRRELRMHNQLWYPPFRNTLTLIYDGMFVLLLIMYCFILKRIVTYLYYSNYCSHASWYRFYYKHKVLAISLNQCTPEDTLPEPCIYYEKRKPLELIQM